MKLLTTLVGIFAFSLIAGCASLPKLSNAQAFFGRQGRESY